MRDPVTKNSRCFGFVTFQDPASVEDVVSSGPHILDDQTVLYIGSKRFYFYFRELYVLVILVGRGAFVSFATFHIYNTKLFV